jgi:L-lactate dehydrogenase (cytochrome)
MVDTASTVLGTPVPMPVVLAPTGYTRIADPQGELAVARAAQRAGVPYTLATMATRSIEEVAAASGDGPRWFQVYVWRDRALVRDLVERSAAAGYEALMITVDTANLGRRERDVRRGFTLPPKLGLDTILDGLVHPGWTWRFARSEPILFANVATSKAASGQYDGSQPIRLAQKVSSQFDPSLSWKDIEWFRSIWDGPIVLKGIQTVADARLAVEHGIDGIALSNHGGRQLDGAPAILELVAPVADAVGGQVEILCDGGVRRGSDVVKALALGANACMVGRAYLYGLGAAGELGVECVLRWMIEELRRTMALVGVTSIGEISAEHVRRRA